MRPHIERDSERQKYQGPYIYGLMSAAGVQMQEYAMTSGLGLMPPSEAPSLEGMEPDERVEAMVEWFRTNFEDPAHNTPYESREGGYQWIWGGPYEASDELQSYFPDASEEEIEIAIEQIEEDGISEWAPSSRRIQPDDIDDEDEPDPQPPLRERIDALRSQLDDLENALGHLRNHAPMIGHNRPPDDMRIDLNQTDLDEAQESIEEVRAELVKANPLEDADPAPLEKAKRRFEILFNKIKGWAISTGKWLGTAVGAAIVSELWENPVALSQKLETIVGTLGSWISYIQFPF